MAAVTTVVTGTIGLPILCSGQSSVIAQASENDLENGREDGRKRANRAFQLRNKAALEQKNLQIPEHLTNGDDDRYRTRIGSYSKGLPHNALGEAVPEAYAQLLYALRTGSPEDFDRVPIGGVLKQVDPQAALAFSLEGSDSHHLSTLAPPAFGSSEEAGEMIELYWQSLTRDVPFSSYESDTLTNAASVELSNLADFRGPKKRGQVTPATLFRGTVPGTLLGPYISQFLLKDVPYPSTPIVQRIKTAIAGIDYVTGYATWLSLQNGGTNGVQQMDATPRYVRNGRDLAEYVHRDFSYQHFLNASIKLNSLGAGALDPNNPYKTSLNQVGFSTFGAPHVLDLLAKVTNYALNCVWYQKWSVHRRLRPEEFGGRIHNHRTSQANYPIDNEVLKSAAIGSF